ncbi:MAG: hypothetical protein G01um101429_303 [Parcubacteria group bacterium Gr01-1014_29]|nr:MAG: hypothetical protein G01um101429_303 [Parcubacteria group bacterium Gr01-1014_29]
MVGWGKNCYISKMIWFYRVLIVFGSMMSFFYGLRAVRIFGFPEKKQSLPQYNKSWYIHQFWFNFVGSATGWFLLLLFFLILKDIKLENLSFAHISIFLTGILGIIGLLPTILAGVATSFANLVGKIIEKLK